MRRWILSSEQSIPQAQGGSEVLVRVLGLDGMVGAMRLRAHQHVAKRAQVRAHVGVIEARVPCQQERQRGNIVDSSPQMRAENEEWDDDEELRDDVVQRMVAGIGEQIELSLGVMNGVEAPEQRDLVSAIVVQPTEKTSHVSSRSHTT